MTTITSSLERSLQNCSLNHINNNNGRRGSGDNNCGVKGKSSSSISSDVTYNFHHTQYHESASSSSDDNSTFVELNSHVSLPYHWEQCLDLKTGELYYVNWSTGRKAKEDPRTSGTGYNGDYYSEEDSNDNDSEEEESSRCDSEESSSCWSSRESLRSMSEKRHQHKQQQELKQEAILVVAGCNSCFMYYMLPKDVHQCPKCCAKLLHFPPNTSSFP